MPVPLFAIIHVLLMSTEIQMIRIYALTVVALVKAMQAIFDWAILNGVGHAVSLDRIRRAIKGTANAKLPIAIRGKARLPFPTFIGAALVNLLPETIFHVPGTGEFIVMPINKAHRNAFDALVKSAGLVGDRGFLSTTAMAVTVGNILRGIMEGHGNSPFLCLIRGRVYGTLPGVFALSTRSIIAQMNECAK